MQFRITRTDVFGNEQYLGCKDTGARNGYYPMANSPEEAVLILYQSKNTFNVGEPLDVECDGKYVGRYRSIVVNPESVDDIVKLPPTPDFIANGREVA